MFPLLPYENEIFLDLFNESGLLVCAKGLCVDRLLYHFVKLYCEPHSLVLVINSSPAEANFMIDQLSLESISPLPSMVSAEVPTKDREKLYKKGGVVFITSRILVVDLLVDRVPVSLVTGVLVAQAHKTLESGQEAFILRMIKEKNPVSFVKAFTDSPVALTTGFSQVARVMTNLFVRKLLVWPRFHASVSGCLNNCGTQVEEIQVQMTSPMASCQASLLDLVDSSLKELARTNPLIDVEELTVEYAITKSFDKLVRLYLDPIWHQLSGQSRQLVADVSTLRRLISQLTASDPVTFFLTVEALRVAEFSASTGSTLRSRVGASWMLLDEADRLFSGARTRVFASASNKGDEANAGKKKLSIELPPKWRAVKQVLDEISELRVGSLQAELAPWSGGRILVLVEDERTADLLAELLGQGEEAVLKGLSARYTTLKEGSYRGGSCDVLGDRRRPAKHKKEVASSTACTTINQPVNPIDISLKEQHPLLTSLSDHLPGNCHALGEPITLILPLRGSKDRDPAGSLPNLLTRLTPCFVLLYDPSMQSVREIEVFKAGHPDLPLRVYFFMYTGSVEEQRYLTQLRKEKESFEHLIKERSSLVLPEQRVGLLPPTTIPKPISTRQAGGGALSTELEVNTVLVDMREFRSELPALLHRRGFQVTPLTLTIADYILTPQLCVERKSVSDLIGSLNSGRLYSQCVAMTRAYKTPVLLIEFTTAGEASTSSSGRGGGFKLFTSGQSSVSATLSASDLLSKLCLLTLHFPALRLLWTVSPYATAELFAELKEGRSQPSINTLPQMELTGLEGISPPDDTENPLAVDLLMKLPGISWKNYRSVINKVKCLLDLADMSEDELYGVLENRESAQQLHAFFHTDHGPELLKSATTDKKKRGANLKLADRVKKKDPLPPAIKKKKK